MTCEQQLTSSQFIASWKMDTFTAIQARFFIRTRMFCSKWCSQHLGMMPLTRGTGASRKMNYYTRHCPFLHFKGKMQTLSPLAARYCYFCNIQDPARFLEQRHNQSVLQKQISDFLIHQNGASDSAWDDAAPAVGEKSWLMVNKDTIKQAVHKNGKRSITREHYVFELFIFLSQNFFIWQSFV